CSFIQLVFAVFLLFLLVFLLLGLGLLGLAFVVQIGGGLGAQLFAGLLPGFLLLFVQHFLFLQLLVGLVPDLLQLVLVHALLGLQLVAVLEVLLVEHRVALVLFLAGFPGAAHVAFELAALGLVFQAQLVHHFFKRFVLDRAIYRLTWLRQIVRFIATGDRDAVFFFAVALGLAFFFSGFTLGFFFFLFVLLLRLFGLLFAGLLGLLGG